MSQWQGDMRHETQQEYFGGAGGAGGAGGTGGVQYIPPQPVMKVPDGRGRIASMLRNDGTVVIDGTPYRWDGDQWVVVL